MDPIFSFLLTLISLAVPAIIMLYPVSTLASVHVEGGLVQGVGEDGITVYKGIPFAAPPTGDLRWKAPQPVIPWDGVLVADEFGSACPQIAFPSTSSMDNSVGNMSEEGGTKI